MSITILVVDDDIGVCRIVHRMLSDEQHKVQIGQSVANALGAVERKPFDVYVKDYKLPEGSGFDVAERIRSKSFKQNKRFWIREVDHGFCGSISLGKCRDHLKSKR
jgi:DNA-binding NtrC family response regulator